MSATTRPPGLAHNTHAESEDCNEGEVALRGRRSGEGRLGEGGGSLKSSAVIIKTAHRNHGADGGAPAHECKEPSGPDKHGLVTQRLGAAGAEAAALP